MQAVDDCLDAPAVRRHRRHSRAGKAPAGQESRAGACRRSGCCAAARRPRRALLAGRWREMPTRHSRQARLRRKMPLTGGGAHVWSPVAPQQAHVHVALCVYCWVEDLGGQQGPQPAARGQIMLGDNRAGVTRAALLGRVRMASLGSGQVFIDWCARTTVDARPSCRPAERRPQTLPAPRPGPAAGQLPFAAARRWLSMLVGFRAAMNTAKRTCVSARTLGGSAGYDSGTRKSKRKVPPA